MQLLPCAKNVCPACAVDHHPDAPHNMGSLYYQYFFLARHGRWPTWADAIAHCAPPIREMSRKIIDERGQWNEPAEGAPIPIYAGVIGGRGVQLPDELTVADRC